MRIEGDSQNTVTKSFKKPEPQSVAEKKPTVNEFGGSKVGEKQYIASTVKTALNRAFDDDQASSSKPNSASLSPSEALDKINNIPLPSLNDPAATRTYQQQRADIADAALSEAKSPNRDDFKGLPPRLAEMEYNDALSHYNNTVKQLEDISTAANADLKSAPTAVLDESAKKVLEAGQYDLQEGGRVLAEEIDALNARYGPEAGGQLIAKLYQDSQNGGSDPNLFNILTFAGGDESNGTGRYGLPEVQRDSIGTAIGQAYDQMSPADRAAFVETAVIVTEANGFRPFVLGGNTASVADLIARSGSSELKTDMVDALTKRMVEIQPGRLGNNGGADIRALANSAAVIAGGGANSAEQTAMFNQIITSFPEMNGKQLQSLMDDPALKDNLSTVFINNSEAIIKSLTNEAGGLLDAKSSDGLRQFFEMTMFSKNPGQMREQVMAEAISVISRFADPTANSTGGRTKVDDARTAGSLIGLVQSAALRQKDSIDGDQKSREQTTKFFVGMAFAFVPGASDVLGEGASKGLSFVYSAGVDYAKSNTESGLGGLISNLTDGDSLANISEGFNAIRDLRFQVSRSFEGEQDQDLYNAFNGGYTETGVDQDYARELGG